jgi:hypothetical protein
MKAKSMMVLAAAAAVVLIVGGESFARGGNGGSGGGRGQGIQTQSHYTTQAGNQTMSQHSTQVRPDGSQRRDGTFLTTGTTANGSNERPGHGNGLMDGTGINHPQSTLP